MNNEINDKRNFGEFKKITFSKFEKSKAKKELIMCLSSAKIESACYWSAEFICSGHFSDLWDIIIEFVSRYIHLGNPRLPIYIAMRFDNFKNIVCNGYLDNDLQLRNNLKIRTIFAEMVSVLCLSRKKHTFIPIKIKRKEEFDMNHLASKLKAPSLKYCTNIFKDEDSKELFIPINELSYHISGQSKNVVNACYWIEWIIEYENLCKSRKEKCICARRVFKSVNDKYQFEPIWLIWDTLLKQCNLFNNPIMKKIMDSLLTIFCIKYTPGVKRRRRFLIYFAISLLTETVDLNFEIVNNIENVTKAVKNIDIIYKEIKKNEITPQTDYLFNGITARSNLDKTIERLERMDSLMKIS